jgi:hypothetical protein
LNLIILLFHFLQIIRLRHTENASIDDIPRRTGLGRDSTFPSVYNFPALSESPSWLPPVKYAVPEPNRYETNVTTLDNGLRVCIYVLILNKLLIGIFFKDCIRKTIR